ncbi:hypothetical protein LPTSP4_11040 [Leptospira ryugenii]|uniref:Uncharacterized protein n=1 Tax=Leptospira ryugenii TaxID=1917863 RepID=A0A2P2DY82_9LEPT|nr:hypothetical protein LPTSP4_11040 [Leptospira ryugenii]
MGIQVPLFLLPGKGCMLFQPDKPADLSNWQQSKLRYCNQNRQGKEKVGAYLY